MLEMLEVNAMNATIGTLTIPTGFANNLHSNNSVINYDANVTSIIVGDTNGTTDAAAAATAILTDVIMNTTAVVVDYAAQWLATATANATINETSTTSTTSASFVLSTSTYSAIADLASAYNSSTYHNNSNISGDLMHPNDDDDDDDDEYILCHPSNPTFNCTREEFLEYVLGPKTLPLWKALLVTIVYGIIFLSGILGNVLVCVVIIRHKAMHTATNYYLFSLAVSDLIYLIFGLPTEVFLYWHQYPYLFGLPFCKVRAFISEACSYVSVFTIVAFSVERYLAICHPLHLYAMSGFKRALRIVALLWVISFVGAIPFGLLSELMYVEYPIDNKNIEDSAFCSMDDPSNLHIFEISFVIFFFIPMILIIYFYGRMGAKIRSRTTQQLGVQQGSMHRESSHQQSRRAVIRMLSAVVLTFFICWLPFHAQRLFYIYGVNCKYYSDINEWLFSCAGFVYYVSCTVNPVLYSVMSHRYRVAFKDILCGKRKSVHYNNGFARDQSSFRETTVASSLCNNGTYNRVNSSYGRSFRITNNLKDRASIKSNNVTWKKTDFSTPLEKEIPENHGATLNSTNAVVVCVDNGVNGRTKVFTENEAQESLLNNTNNETCI